MLNPFRIRITRFLAVLGTGLSPQDDRPTTPAQATPRHTPFPAVASGASLGPHPQQLPTMAGQTTLRQHTPLPALASGASLGPHPQQLPTMPGQTTLRQHTPLPAIGNGSCQPRQPQPQQPRNIKNRCIHML